MAPAALRWLPTEIPYAHTLQTEPSNVVLVQSSKRAVIEDPARVQENAGRRDEVTSPAGLASGDFAAAGDQPRCIRLGQYNAQLLLYRWIAVDDHQQLRSVDYEVLGIDDRLGAIDPQSVQRAAVDGVPRDPAQ